MGLSFECGLGEQKKVVMAESAAQKWRGPRVSESRHVLNAESEARTCPLSNEVSRERSGAAAAQEVMRSPWEYLNPV